MTAKNEEHLRMQGCLSLPQWTFEKHFTVPLPCQFVAYEQQPHRPPESEFRLKCHECGETTTTQRRRGPDGPNTLCNKRQRSNFRILAVEKLLGRGPSKKLKIPVVTWKLNKPPAVKQQ